MPFKNQQQICSKIILAPNITGAPPQQQSFLARVEEYRSFLSHRAQRYPKVNVVKRNERDSVIVAIF